MHKALLHALVWIVGTGGAVTLSWWGVHSVMTEQTHVPPRALPFLSASPSPSPSAAATTVPPSPRTAPPVSAPVGTPASPRGTAAAPRTTAPAQADTKPPATAPTPSPGSADSEGRIAGYDTAGGRAVFDLGSTSATLVSAVPRTGWSMQVWKTADWIRVEFTSGAEHVSVICTWHDGPPSVDVGTY
ncbi:hypothetical protein [Streptomyces sp. NPDC060184]|uniref:hypothetical protein n=1 Tax=Streptomyces sp. NPDC060184 TaxID=3347064 RepID=UPI0036584C3E